jgi:putative YhdH/YhfP family quinone oxidoreductase
MPAFKALRITETAAGKFERNIIQQHVDDLPEGEVVIQVHYSSLNYKDALSATGNKGITRRYPHTPGIDAAGVVVLSRDERFVTGQEVLVTGYDLGMNCSGGWGAYIRVKADWVVPKPEALSLRETMIYGTAGFTAAMALYKMEKMGQQPAMGPVVVTGSTGGVGSMAVALLTAAGYDTIAVTGKTTVNEYLQYLGAKRIENRDFVSDRSGKALLKQQWAGAIDTVGGNTLATLLKACKAEGSVVSTGLVASPELHTTVYPFILNGINLLGIGSAETPMAVRKIIWDKLAGEWNITAKFNAIAKECSLEELKDKYIDDMLAGRIVGRILVKLQEDNDEE